MLGTLLWSCTCVHHVWMKPLLMLMFFFYVFTLELRKCRTTSSSPLKRWNCVPNVRPISSFYLPVCMQGVIHAITSSSIRFHTCIFTQSYNIFSNRKKKKKKTLSTIMFKPASHSPSLPPSPLLLFPPLLTVWAILLNMFFLPLTTLPEQKLQTGESRMSHIRSVHPSVFSHRHYTILIPPYMPQENSESNGCP